MRKLPVGADVKASGGARTAWLRLKSFGAVYRFARQSASKFRADAYAFGAGPEAWFFVTGGETVHLLR